MLPTLVGQTFSLPELFGPAKALKAHPTAPSAAGFLGEVTIDQQASPRAAPWVRTARGSLGRSPSRREDRLHRIWRAHPRPFQSVRPQGRPGVASGSASPSPGRNLERGQTALCGHSISNFISNLSENSFLESDLIGSAVVQKLAVIGEAAGRVSPELRSRHPQIPWAGPARKPPPTSGKRSKATS